MRSVSQVWGALNASRTRERRFYLRIEPIPGDTTGDVYIRSHDDISITTDGVVLLAKPKSHPKIRTQALNPDEGRSTIGTMSFDAIDIDQSLTDEMRTALLSNDVGWRQKRVQYFSGFRQIDSADYELEDTQLIDRVSYSKGVYQFRCRDIQREMRKRIFEPLVARLAQPLDATATTVEIFFDPGFEAVEHGVSYSDAPSGSWLYVKIDEEIIRVPASGIGSTQLTDCVRGVLGTRAAAHTTDENASASRAKEVREVIYLELPVPKLVYALLTGNLIGQSGTLPDHWHLGIDAGDFVRLADFQTIGSDLYVQANDALGMVERYILTDVEDGKSFIEREILRKYGLFMPIHADGAIGLRRGQPVLSGSAVAGVIDDSLIVEDVTLTYAMDRVVNDIRIGWNEIDGEPSRFLTILDTESLARWGTAPRLEVVARGLVGSRQTDSRVLDIFEGLRDRYSGPPLTCEVTVFSSQSLYEVGDVIRLRTSRVRDFTNSETSLLDRAFEIQGVSKDLAGGTVTYQLFGSSQKAGALPPLESTAALDDAFYSGTGTNIAGMSGVVDAGTELVLPDGITFTGASTVAAAVFYALKDVRLPAGDTANYTQNVQLRIKGVLQIEGEFNGVGAGLAGVADTVSVGSIPNFGAVQGPINFATQAGTPGYFGKTQAAGALIERVRQRDDSASKYRVRLQSVPATITAGSVEAIPSLNLVVAEDGLSISGVPVDLRGTSGGPGGVRHWDDSKGPTIQTNRGGTGGAGGAGLLIISRGLVFGASGRIDSSGANGSAGVRNAANERPAWSGGGAGGAPGATLILLDGSSAPSPVLSSGTIIADYGATPEPGDPHNYMPDAYFESQETRFGPPTVTGAFVEEDRVSFFRSSSSGLQAGIAAARMFFLLPPVAPGDADDDEALANVQDISIAVTESFSAVEDATLTQILVTVTEVDTTAAYSHANIYTRRTTGDAPDPDWVFQGGADPKLRFILPADGETYTIRAVPVLINGVEATEGVEETQIVSTPGLNRLVASVSYNRQNIWRRAPNAGAWTPSETTVDGTVEFVDTTGVVASRTVRATLNTSAGTITVDTGHATSGEATTASAAGSGTASLAVTVEHDDTGIKAVLNFAAVESGSDGTSVTILGTKATVGDLPGSGNTVGDGWIVDGDLYVWDGSDWNNAGPIQGPAGDDGLSVAEVLVYRRATSAPATPTGGSYDFGTKVLTPPSSWSVGVPAGTDPVYVSRATAYIIGQTGSYSSFTWSSPVLAFQNGTDGAPGESVDIIFRRSASQPSTPAASSGTPAGWYSDVSSVPASSDPLWSSVGTRPTPSSNWTWQTPIQVEGQSGTAVAELSIYRRASSAPATPTGGTYTFGTDTINSIPAGWSRGVPAGTDPIYISRAVASIIGPTGTSGTLTWSAPVLSMQNGADGASGISSAPVMIYRRSATTPALPTAAATYTFATGAITGLNNSWSATVPAADGNPLWVSHASASSTGATDTIASGEWSAPQKMAEDGAAGGNTAVAYLYQRASSAPGAPTGSLTYTFATGALTGTPGNGWSATIPAVNGNPLWVRTAVAFSTGASDTIAAAEWSASVQILQDGASGTPAVNVVVTKDSLAAWSYADGSLPSGALDNANGQLTVTEGATDVTASATLSASASGCTGTINTATNTPVSGQPKGYFRVTAMSADVGVLTLTAVYGSQTFVRKFSVTKQKGGYEIVANLTALNALTGPFEGRLVFVTSEGKLYRYTGGAWTAAVPAGDISGQITQSQIADAAISVAKFASGIRPVEIVASLPSSGNFEGRMVYLTTDDKLYRHTGSAWVSTVAAADVTGTLADSQIAALAASKITGTLTNAQIADLAATKITGTLTNAQIADLAAAKLTGQIVGTQITDGAISTAKLAAGSVTTAKLTANAVTANEIAAAAVTAAKISAGAVTTAKLAANAVTANEIAANAIVAAKIAAGAIEAAKIAAGAVEALKIAAGAVTAEKIAALAVTADKIAANAIIAGKIAAGAISASEIAAGAITASRLAVTDAANLFPDDGDFEVEYSGSSIYYERTTEQAYTGTYSLKHDVSAATRATMFPALIPVREGEQFLFRGRYKTTASFNGNPRFRILPYDAAKNAGSQILLTGPGSLPQTTWTEISCEWTVPAGVAYIQIGLYQVGTGSPVGTWYIDALECRRMNAGELIVDGAITAGKVAAGAITAGKIAANAVTATELAANAVTADKIIAGAVTAAKIAVTDLSSIAANIGTITAGLLRNSASTFFVDATNAMIYSGKPTFDSADEGWWIGHDDGEPAFHFGGDKWIKYKPSTGLLQNNANNTISTSDYQTAAVTVTSDVTWTQIISASIDTGGNRVFVMFSALGGPNGTAVGVEVRRGSTVIASFTHYVTGVNVMLSFNVGEASPPAGSNTYSVWMKKPNSGFASSGWSRRSIMLQGSV